jgi:L-asparagine transporter-like permease
MNTWLIVFISYLLVGIGSYVCILAFFPPQDCPPENADSPVGRDLDPRPMPWTLGLVGFVVLVAVPSMFLMLIFSPALMLLFIWQRARDKTKKL